MSTGDVVGVIECPMCGEKRCTVRETKTGGLSEACSGCGYQGFAKSPKAVAGRRAKLATADPKAPKKEKEELPEWLAKL